jgi:hypothetical protein
MRNEGMAYVYAPGEGGAATPGGGAPGGGRLAEPGTGPAVGSMNPPVLRPHEPEFDDRRTAYVSGGTVSTRYRGRYYAMSDVCCVTLLHPPAVQEGGGQPGVGRACGHPFLSHDPVSGRCGRCACQGHRPSFEPEVSRWCLYCAREFPDSEMVGRVNRRGRPFWVCAPCDVAYPERG